MAVPVAKLLGLFNFPMVRLVNIFVSGNIKNVKQLGWPGGIERPSLEQ